jgi:hypothetical protein
MSFYIRKIIMTEITDSFESGYSCGLTLYGQFDGIELDETLDDFFDKVKLLSGEIFKLDAWNDKPHLMTLIGSNFKLNDHSTIEEANQYLNEEYGDLEVIDESLDTYFKIYW